MKKHSFLEVDYHSTVKLSQLEKSTISKWLKLSGEVLRSLVDEGIIKSKPQSLYVSLLICGEERIKELNQEFRKKNKVTDVLSFPHFDDLRKEQVMDEVLVLGDMAICHEQTIRQAVEFDVSYFDEFIHLFFHGVIHLMGYDHERSSQEEKLMETWEKKALDLFSKIKKGAS